MQIRFIKKISNIKLSSIVTSIFTPLSITLLIFSLSSTFHSSLSVAQSNSTLSSQSIAPQSIEPQSAIPQLPTKEFADEKNINASTLSIQRLSFQRQYYLDARESLDKKEFEKYAKLKQKLSDYPLLPYLEYQELLIELPNKPYNQIDQFLEEYSNSYLAERLLKKWLQQLAQEKRWHEYRTYYDKTITSAAEQCLYIWSLIQTGEQQAFEQVAALWSVGKSQPTSCTPLFNAWKKKGYLTEELIWSRYQKTSRTRKNMRLIRYLERIMSPSSKLVAKKYVRTIKNPERLNNINDYSNNHPFTKTIVLKSLLKYIRKDSKRASNLWEKYQEIFSFTPQEKQKFNFSLAKRKAFDHESEEVKKLLPDLSIKNQATIVEIILREYLKDLQWQPFYAWLNLLPTEERLSDRWQYWQARYYQQSDDSKNLYLPIYEKLSKTRSYYGFLSADFLEKPYSLQNIPSVINIETLTSLQNNEALKRIRELYLINKVHTARNEWRYATKNFTKEEFITLAQLTNRWGWHRKSIESMAAATSWNDLAIRFPVAHQDIISEQAAVTRLPSTLIFAIARQESAWEKDAHSSAGAMGLMQILPRTAKETAKKAGIKYRRKDLLMPEKNIILGSRYISGLLERYENNRITAIAAYNAGPSRVNRWLKESDRNLPHDIWIEVIPFGETRKYVQNVLSYAVVYGDQMGNAESLLTELEKKRPL